MAHAMSAQGIKNAVRAGVRTIEHGCFLDEEGIALMRQGGATLVPTLVAPVDVIRNAAKDPASIPESMVQKARDTVERHAASFGRRSRPASRSPWERTVGWETTAATGRNWCSWPSAE